MSEAFHAAFWGVVTVAGTVGVIVYIGWRIVMHIFGGPFK